MSSLDKPPPPPIVIKDGLPALSAEEQAEMEALPDYEIRQKIGKWWDKKGVTCWIPEVEHDFRSKRDRKREWSVELGSIADRFGNIVPCFFIWSKYLRKIIRGAIKFDGALDRQSPRFDVDEPYCTFFHHWDDIQAKFLADKDASEDDRDTFAALTWAYNNGIFEDSDDDVTPRELHDSIRDSIKEGFINFNAIWALYKPGSKILFKDSLGEWQMAMCVACTKAIRDGKNLRYEPPTWEVTLWHMTWNAADECFTRTVGTYRLKRFTGTRRIVTLPLLPLEFYQDQTSQLSPAECQSQLENELRDRGLKWKKFVSEPPRCFFYDGPAATMLYPARGNMIRSINEPPRRIRDDSPSRGPSKTTKLKGRIVVEQNQNLAFADLYDRNSPDMFSMDVSGDDDREEFAAFDNCAKDSEFEPTEVMALIVKAQESLTDIPGDCGDEYRRAPLLTVTGDLSHHLKASEANIALQTAVQEGKRIEYSSGNKWESIAGYCRAVRTGDTIRVSGTTANSPDSRIKVLGGSSAASQTVAILDIIARAVRAVGGEMKDVVRTRIMVRNLEDVEEISQVHGWVLGCLGVRPSNTLVLAGLVGAEYLVEIEAEAVVGYSNDVIRL